MNVECEGMSLQCEKRSWLRRLINVCAFIVKIEIKYRYFGKDLRYMIDVH